jgi:hypothetical protein
VPVSPLNQEIPSRQLERKRTVSVGSGFRSDTLDLALVVLAVVRNEVVLLDVDTQIAYPKHLREAGCVLRVVGVDHDLVRDQHHVALRGEWAATHHGLASNRCRVIGRPQHPGAILGVVFIWKCAAFRTRLPGPRNITGRFREGPSNSDLLSFIFSIIPQSALIVKFAH